jgi:ribosome-associated protein
MRHQSRHIPPRVTPDLPSIPESEVRFTTARSGGPGGQNVNKVSTKVHLHFNLWGSRTLTSDQQRAIFTTLTESNDKRFIDGDIVITSQEHRSQLANKVAALQKLNDLVRDILTPKVERIATEAPESVDVRRRSDKRARSERKELRRNRFDL